MQRSEGNLSDSSKYIYSLSDTSFVDVCKQVHLSVFAQTSLLVSKVYSKLCTHLFFFERSLKVGTLVVFKLKHKIVIGDIVGKSGKFYKQFHEHFIL